MKYALLIYSPSGAREYGESAADPTNAIVDYTCALRDAGVLAGAEQLTHTDTATSVRVRSGDRLLTDGPFMETKEHLLGFFLIDVPGLDDALDWGGADAGGAPGPVAVGSGPDR
jgi:hypothetical protein